MKSDMSACIVSALAGLLCIAAGSAAEPPAGEKTAKTDAPVKVEEIDRNFQQAKIGNVEFRFINAESGAPLSLEGLPWRLQSKSGNPFRRLPDSMSGKINGGAFWLANHTSGAALRFRTDSRKIAIRGTLAWSLDMNHMARAGSSGFDIYRGNGPEAFHCGTFQPNAKQSEFAVTIYGSGDGKMSDYILNFPLYGGVKKLEIGILPGSKLEAPSPHKVTKPILFYGSSITQGGCASRPGNMYPSHLCRAVDAEQINLGFSGGGKGEPAVAELIASLDLACFVFDYDYNAPSEAHLRNTHEPFFQIIRKARPDLPIIIMSKCSIWRDTDYGYNSRRREIIRKTFENAVGKGDRHVYFIDGETLFGTAGRDGCTVDRCHPNDLGFYRMYECVLPVLRKALAEAEK